MQDLKDLTFNVAVLKNTADERFSSYVEELSTELKKTLKRGYDLTAQNQYAIARASSLINAYRKTGNRWLPRPLLVTQPKSGTKHVETYLTKTFNYARLTPPHGYNFHNRDASFILPVFYSESEFLFGSRFISYHFCASKELTYDIEGLNLDTIILLRHPIQALVSHYHYLTTGRHRDFGTKHTHQPGSYFGPFEIDSHDDVRRFLINTVYPRIILFIDDWMEWIAAQKSHQENLRVTLLSQEILAHDPDLFHNKLACAIGEESGDQWRDYESITNHNFRSGKTSEWKDFFTRAEFKSLLTPYDQLMSRRETLTKLFML